MSNEIINIRFGLYHFKVDKGFTNIRISKNEYHRGYPDGFFKVHCWFN